MRLWGRGTAVGLTQTVQGRLTSVPIEDRASRGDWIAFGTTDALSSFGDADGYAAFLCVDRKPDGLFSERAGVYAPVNLDYLGDRDVVALSPDGGVRVWYRRASENNTILITEQCNSYCLMCSQPPKRVDDSFRVPSVLRLLDLIDPAARELVLSGGEPTIAGDGFFQIIERARDNLPLTALHVLTNGRNFRDKSLAKRLASIRHHDLMLGIPLYSDVDWRHDYVVQARGAYDETLAGIYNLAMQRVRLELRVVLHRQTVDRLPQLAEFIGRNLPFVEHVALMGLEMFGFTPRNIDVLWSDPLDYQERLQACVESLALQGMNVSIYNHQLCTLPRGLWPFARQSISDWKNVFVDECNGCSVKQFCAGFFQSATKKHSRGIKAQNELPLHTRQKMDELHGPPAVAALSV